MNKIAPLILGLVMPFGIIFSQIPAEKIEQFEKAMLEREIQPYRQLKSFEPDAMPGRPLPGQMSQNSGTPAPAMKSG